MDEQTGSEAQGLVRVKILHSSATDCYCYDRAMALERDDLVVVPTRYGSELGRVQGALSGKLPENRQPPQVTRRASETDLQRFESQRQREASAFLTCRQKIAEHGLDMKLVSAHYMMDEKKLLFYFTAESRVDFRQLVRDLVGVFKTRIELRQIGVRDEAGWWVARASAGALTAATVSRTSSGRCPSRWPRSRASPSTP
jgi:cell fate regulator YaaT (PSP1 superfamily)